MIAERHLKFLLEEMKALGSLPKHIEKTVIKSVYFYNVFNEPLGDIMSYNVATGVDVDEGTAALKAVVEHIERKAFSESSKNSLFPLHNFSDGFAAMPSSIPLHKTKARQNALAEATERYVWSSWWDNKSGSLVEEIDLNKLTPETRDLLSYMESSNFFLIEPLVENNSGINTIIIFAKLKSGGYVSGGASGPNKEVALFRASSEIIRHYLGYLKSKTLALSPAHFYDERLIFFASGAGNDLVEDRLSTVSNNVIVLPKLIYDRAVPHGFEKVVYVHRCLFENQPLFVGGNLNRLCL